ncbi:hypothetical protein DFH11DRAFT_1601938 [Phellopilus nigrolimitatus]|nr:hypothetical protein DFH11DRAFT_1601938 [Phellopilus nigrolimitatus]
MKRELSISLSPQLRLDGAVSSKSVSESPMPITPRSVSPVIKLSASPERPRRLRRIVEVVVPPVPHWLRSADDTRLASLRKEQSASIKPDEDVTLPSRGNEKADPIVVEQVDEAEVAALMAKIKNTKVKKEKGKKELPCLPDDTVYAIIKQMGLLQCAVTLEDLSLLHTPVNRKFLSDVYGGGQQLTFPEPRKEKVAEHGITAFMCLNLAYNPLAAQMPGAPGLFFGCTRMENKGWKDKRDRRVYKCINRIGANQWLYLGDYELVSGRELTSDEWRSQPRICRRTWATGLATTEWGRFTRAYIRLRRNLTDDEQVSPEAIEELEKKMKTQPRLEDVTADEIERAFAVGHMLISVSEMQCVYYDENFQRELVEKFRTWVPPSPKKKGEAGGKRKRNSKDEGGARRKRATKKPKPESDMEEAQSARDLPPKNVRPRRTAPEVPESDIESETDDEAMDIDDLSAIRDDEEGGEAAPLKVYAARGTRSRPAKEVKYF